MDLPIEVLHLVFSDFSQHDLITCSLVCQSWHQAIQPLLYNTVKIHAKETFYKLHKVLKKKRKNGTYGGLVKCIDFCNVDRLLIDNQLASLQEVCPNVKRIRLDNDNSDARPSLLKKWKQLEVLSVDPQVEPNRTWHHAADQLIRLFVRQQLLSYVSKRGRYQPPTLASVLPPTLLSLTELYVDVHMIDAGKSSAEFLPCLATRCPSLTSLTLDYKQVSTDDMDKFGTININNEDSVSDSLTTLSILATGFRTQIPLYMHYATLFPHLETLATEVNIDRYSRDFKAQHKAAFYDMLTHLPHLTSLSLCLNVRMIFGRQSNDFDEVIPTATMLENWMKDRQMKQLAWPCSSLLSLPSSVNDLRHRFYLDQLTSLEVCVDSECTPADLLRSLLHHNTEPTLPAQLTKLVLNGVGSNFSFDLTDWVTASPNLKELNLRSLGITDRNNNSNNNNNNNNNSNNNFNDNEGGSEVEVFGQLERLTLQSVTIRLKNGFTDLLRSCPNLKCLECFGSTINAGDPEQHTSFQWITQDDGSVSFVYLVDINGLNLDTLSLSAMSLAPSDKCVFSPMTGMVTHLCLIEQGHDESEPLWLTLTASRRMEIDSFRYGTCNNAILFRCHRVDKVSFR